MTCQWHVGALHVATGRVYTCYALNTPFPCMWEAGGFCMAGHIIAQLQVHSNMYQRLVNDRGGSLLGSAR